MIFTGTWRTLTGFVNGPAIAIPDVARITPFPHSHVTSLDRVAQPILDQPLLIGQVTRAHAGIRPAGTGNAGETGNVLMVGAPDIAAGLRYLGEIDAGWRCLNPARFRIAPLKLRFSHGVDSVPLPGTGDVPLALSVRDSGSAPYFLPRNSIQFGFPFKIDGIARFSRSLPIIR